MEALVTLMLAGGIMASFVSVFVVLFSGVFFVLLVIIMLYAIKVLRLLAKFLAVKVKRGY